MDSNDNADRHSRVSWDNRATAVFRALIRRADELAQKLISRLPSLGVDESTLLLAFGLLIGAAVGVAVIIFYELINFSQRVSLDAAGRLEGLGRLSIIAVVLLGLAVARAMVRLIIDDDDGANVSDVMRAVVKRGGVVPALPVAVKTASAAVAIGAGGSVGAEGPIAVAGSALGSGIGRTFRSGPGRLKVLVACGAAAGISAAFNAPIAGVFFSLEKVMGTFGVAAFPPVLVASVVAAAISRGAFGDTPVIAIPTEYSVGSASELVFYALLGVLTGMVAVVYIRATYRTADVFERLGGAWRQVVVGAILVGVLDVIFRGDLWGRGHETLSLEIFAERSGYFLIVLAFAKIAATAVTLSAVRAGGVFTPALFTGATISGGAALLLQQVVPGFTIQPEAFALAGMAGLVAAATHAPLTGIMMVFEMTSDYALILPLMLTGAIAYITARRLHPHSIYSEWLARRGESISFGQDLSVMQRLRVSECYDPDPDVVSEGATVSQIIGAIGASTQTEFPVVDSDLRFVGMLSYNDLRSIMARADELGPLVLAGDVASEDYESVNPGDTLRTALQRLSVRGSHHIPVVAPEDPGRLLGLISRQDVLTSYDRELLRLEEEMPLR